LRWLDRLLSLLRMNLPLSILFAIPIVIDLLYGDLDWRTFPAFAIPLAVSLLLSLPYLWRGRVRPLRGKEKPLLAMASFAYMVFMCALPFSLIGMSGPLDSLFESMAGLSTTCLSRSEPSEFLGHGHGLLFYRIALQWVGGLFYIIVTFLILAEINDLARRSAEKRLFTRIGLVPRLSDLLYNLTAVYVVLTLLAVFLFVTSGHDLFGSVTLSMASVSTGGYSEGGRSIGSDPGLHISVAALMVLSGIGYHVYIGLLSGRGRSRAVLEAETGIYALLVLAGSVFMAMVLFGDGMALGTSLWKGLCSSVASTTTTGIAVSGTDSFPDEAKVLMLILMLVGASSLSMSSGFKVRRLMVLVVGFIAEVKRSAHPRMVIAFRRGEGIYSNKALEMAATSFFYFFFAILASTGVLIVFGGDIFELLSLSITSMTNSGIAFGEYSTTAGIASLNPVQSTAVILVMFLGRFEVLLPLYLLRWRSYTFNG